MLSALMPQVWAAANSARRALAQSHGIVKKAVGYTFETVKALIQGEVLPGAD